MDMFRYVNGILPIYIDLERKSQMSERGIDVEIKSLRSLSGEIILKGCRKLPKAYVIRSVIFQRNISGSHG